MAYTTIEELPIITSEQLSGLESFLVSYNGDYRLILNELITYFKTSGNIQEKLIDNETIRTINGNSLLGTGDLIINTSITYNNDVLSFLDSNGIQTDINLATYLDNTTNAITNVTLDNGILTFFQEDGTELTVDVSILDNVDSHVVDGLFIDGKLILTRNNELEDIIVDLDGRYRLLTPSNSTTIQSGENIIDFIPITDTFISGECIVSVYTDVEIQTEKFTFHSTLNDAKLTSYSVMGDNLGHFDIRKNNDIVEILFISNVDFANIKKDIIVL